MEPRFRASPLRATVLLPSQWRPWCGRTITLPSEEVLLLQRQGTKHQRLHASARGESQASAEVHGRDGDVPPAGRGPRAGVSPRFVAAADGQKSSGRAGTTAQ